MLDHCLEIVEFFILKYLLLIGKSEVRGVKEVLAMQVAEPSESHMLLLLNSQQTDF